MTPVSLTILKHLRELKPRLYQEMGIKRLRVFGSVGRGEATSDSDLDLLVEFEKTPGLEFFTMDDKISSMMGGIKVDLATEGCLHPMLKNRILREARDV